MKKIKIKNEFVCMLRKKRRKKKIIYIADDCFKMVHVTIYFIVFFLRVYFELINDYYDDN